MYDIYYLDDLYDLYDLWNLYGLYRYFSEVWNLLTFYELRDAKQQVLIEEWQM